jgi:Pretoxin HINT domain
MVSKEFNIIKIAFLVTFLFFIGFVNATPQINFTSPPNNTQSGSLAQTFIANISDTASLTNATLYIWNSTGSQLNAGYSWCYQESANTSNQPSDIGFYSTSNATGVPSDGNCGLSYTGSYYWNNTLWPSASVIEDGNWSNSSFIAGGNPTTYFYVNYTKPTGAQPSSIWAVRAGSVTNLSANYSFPSSIWNYNSTGLELLITATNPGCFLSGTMVWMSNGTYKNIEDVKIGDIVKSYNESSREIVNSTVINIYYHNANQMGVDYYMIINNFLEVTPNHPILVNGQWQQIGNAKIGDYLQDENGNRVYIANIQKIYQKVPVYNLEINDTHNYFANGILVHNKPDTPLFTFLYGYNGTNYTVIANVSGYIVFEEGMYWNVSNSLTNNVSGLTNSTNWTYTFSNTTAIYYWNILAADSSGNTSFNATNYTLGIFANSCGCPLSNTNWNISMGDYCVVNSSGCNIGVGNLSWYGSGNCTFNTSITAKSKGSLPASSILWVGSNYYGKYG